METFVEAIRAAVAPDATPEVKTTGIAACRAILAALDAAGHPMTAPVPASPVAAIVGALRGVPPDQLIDMAIAKLRAALPADANVAAVAPFKMPFVGVPKLGAGQG